MNDELTNAFNAFEVQYEYGVKKSADTMRLGQEELESNKEWQRLKSAVRSRQDEITSLRALVKELSDALEREEKRFIIRSNDDGSVWVSPHRWLKGHCTKATVFSSAFYAKQAVKFEEKSKSGREQLPQVYEIMEDGRLRLVNEEECAK